MVSKMQMLHLARSAPSESEEFHMLVKHGLPKCSTRTKELLPVPGYAKYSRVQNPETSGTLNTQLFWSGGGEPMAGTVGFDRSFEGGALE